MRKAFATYLEPLRLQSQYFHVCVVDGVFEQVLGAAPTGGVADSRAAAPGVIFHRASSIDTPLDDGYRAMAVDAVREVQAAQWCNALVEDMQESCRITLDPQISPMHHVPKIGNITRH